MHDDTFDDVVFNGGAKQASIVELLTSDANVQQRLTLGNHHGHLGKTVASTKSVQIGILLHVDIHRFVEFIVENVAENAVIGANKVLSMGLYHHVWVLIRLDSLNSKDMYGTFRKVTIAVTHNETSLGNVIVCHLMRDVNNGSIRDLGEDHPLHRRSVIVGSAPVTCQRDNGHL